MPVSAPTPDAKTRSPRGAGCARHPECPPHPERACHPERAQRGPSGGWNSLPCAQPPGFLLEGRAPKVSTHAGGS